MLTLHTADLLLTAVPGAAPVPGGAVVVDGATVAAAGPYEDVAAAFPQARVRRWPGVLTPGLRQWYAKWLLQQCYHPDPREYEELGERPLTGERLAALEMSEARRAGSVRRGIQQMLRHGTTAVIGICFDDPVVATALDRSGLRFASLAWRPGVLVDEPSLDPLRNVSDPVLAFAEPLTVGGRADLAVFDVPDEAALMKAGAGTCVATVLGGRLVYRRR
ncbi:hypothetical protein IPZ58_17185 [Streptomyces roseoverticillatus]|uniref:amidohydrolase family protein n=1 Tax=Streptomyces roseoverticillatus TaxID=66429 RepID=UPI001F197D55|nr:hypothetical protein [Streptomyces roseoverticillatus]MCF3103301.1 hypothetical protein [Streptomyces roseoverticillatus]